MSVPMATLEQYLNETEQVALQLFVAREHYRKVQGKVKAHIHSCDMETTEEERDGLFAAWYEENREDIEASNTRIIDHNIMAWPFLKRLCAAACYNWLTMQSAFSPTTLQSLHYARNWQQEEVPSSVSAAKSMEQERPIRI